MMINDGRPSGVLFASENCGGDLQAALRQIALPGH
jgi:hypothetical protein